MKRTSLKPAVLLWMSLSCVIFTPLRAQSNLFDELHPVQGGWFYGKTGADWIIVDSAGQEAFRIVYRYPDARDAYIRIRHKGLVGMIDSSGKMVIQPKYHWIATYEGDVAKCGREQKTGLVNTAGVEIVPVEYDHINAFTKEYYYETSPNDPAPDYVKQLYVLKKQKLVWLFHKQRGILDPEPSHGYSHFYEGMAVFVLNGKCGFIDTLGKVVIPASFDAAASFSGGLARVLHNKLMGMINRQGELVLPCQYKTIDDFKDGVAVAFLPNRQKQYINTRGQVIPVEEQDDDPEMAPEIDENPSDTETGTPAPRIQPGNTTSQAPTDAREPEKKPGKPKAPGYVTDSITVSQKAGRWILTAPAAPAAWDPGADDNGWVAIRKNGKWGWKNASGKITIPCRYDAVLPFRNGKAPVFLKSFGRPVLINRKGEIILEYGPSPD